jgi:hypothetical protein
MFIASCADGRGHATRATRKILAFLCVAAPSAIMSKISMKEAAYLIIGTKTAFVWSENFRKWQALTPDRQIT